MDDLKFRVWHEKHKRYVDFEDLAIDMSGRLLDRDRYVLNQKEYIIERCTGLKDCNGKLIFEGDKLEYRNNDKLKVFVSYSNIEVAWILILASSGRQITQLTRGDLWKVIGTIHDEIAKEANQ